MGKAQIIKCKCGNAFAACMEPECYLDKTWANDLRKYVKNGCSVEIIDTSENKIILKKCECNKPKQLLIF